jgi:hypothetical protein
MAHESYLSLLMSHTIIDLNQLKLFCVLRWLLVNYTHHTAYFELSNESIL